MNKQLNFKSRLCLALLALLSSLNAMAYEQLQLNQEFLVKNFDFSTVWEFTPEENGIAQIVGVSEDAYFGPCLNVFDSQDMTLPIENFQYDPARYEILVNAGQTYYIKSNNWSGQDIRAKITMDSGSASLAFTGAVPEDGAKFSVAGNETVYLRFNTANVTYTKGEVTINGNVINIYNYNDWNELAAAGIVEVTQQGTSGVENWKGNLFGRTENGIAISFTSHTGSGFYNPVYRLYEEGKIAAGDEMVLTMHGVKSILTGELLDGTGDLTVTWEFGGAPTTLVSSQLPSTLLSWYNEGDESAVASFTFSRDISFARGYLEMGQGEGADDLYEEDIPASKISFDGPTVYVDFSGKMRTNTTMNLKNRWPSFTFHLINVVDAEGNETYSPDLGSASSYTFQLPYSDISANVSYDFFPETGAELTDDVKQIEIWFDNSDVINWDGVTFTYYTLDEVEDVDNEGNPVTTLQNVAHETFIAKADLDVTVDAYGTTILAPVPEGISSARNIRVAVNILSTADGIEHPIVAYYNASVLYDIDLLPYVSPADGAELNYFNELYLTLGMTYAINDNLKTPVTVQGLTNNFATTGRIVADGKVNAKIVLDQPISAEGTYAVTIAEGAIGDMIYGDSKFQSGTANIATTVNYHVSGIWDGRTMVATPDDGETVSALSQIVLTSLSPAAIAPSWNVEEVPYVEEVVAEGEPAKFFGSFLDHQTKANEVTFVLDQPVTAKGNYRFVLPAKALLNGANGDYLAESYTFNYTVEPSAVITKPVVDPAEGTYDEIGNILIDFGQPVTIVEPSEANDWWVPQPNLISTDGGWTLFASGQLEATANPNVLQWTNWGGTAVKACDAVFTIPAGCVAYADGTVNEAAEYNYTITGANDNSVELNVVSTDPELWGYVDELTEMTVTFDQPVTFSEWDNTVNAYNNFYTKFANGELQYTDDPYTLKIVFPEPLINFGTTTIAINPCQLMVGEQYFEEGIYLYITIGEESTGGEDPIDEDIQITPAAYSTVPSLQYFEITFGGFEGAWNEEPITLEDAYENVVATVPAYGLSGCDKDGNWFWETGQNNTYSITLPEEITADGFYFLHIPAICETTNGTVSRDLWYMYEVDSTATGLTTVRAEQIDSIYTLGGQKIERVNRPGIYIINGRRVLVK